MASHHFIGVGQTSDGLRAAAADPESLLGTVHEIVEGDGLRVVSQQATRFPGGGLTLVWVLAESHLVLHYWAAEGFSTIDLHICDYEASNVEKAERLQASLETFCFVPATCSWHRANIADPVPVAPVQSVGQL